MLLCIMFCLILLILLSHPADSDQESWERNIDSFHAPTHRACVCSLTLKWHNMTVAGVGATVKPVFNSGHLYNATTYCGHFLQS